MEKTKKETSRNKVALITKGDAHLMIEDDMRRWTVTISHSHAVTNNPNWSRTIQVNRTLLSHTWTQRIYTEPLTTGNFRFLCKHEISDFDVMTVQADDPTR